jgi:High potential iron-sulfur protein
MSRTNPPDLSLARRRLLRHLALAVSLGPVIVSRPGTSHAAEDALLNPESQAAKAVKYFEDASKAVGVTPGSACVNCALYQGTPTASQGPCQLFPGKEVKAGGWCSMWAPQM